MKNTIDVLRGLVKWGSDNRSETLKHIIETPTHEYNISKVYTKTYELKKRYKVLGVAISNEFSICYDIRLTNGEMLFGYFTSNDNNGNYQVQLINGFNKFAYNPYENTYSLGKEIKIKEAEIKDAVYQFKDLFYTEFSD